MFKDRHTVLDSGCREWDGCKLKSGYGQLSINSKTVYSHRAYYKKYKGEISEGFYVCHACDNPSCVNPDHLFLGTHQDNMNDRNKKNRQARGKDMVATRNTFTKISDEGVSYIRENVLNLSRKELATMFNISYQHVRDLINRKYRA